MDKLAVPIPTRFDAALPNSEISKTGTLSVDRQFNVMIRILVADLRYQHEP
jgi:hypothetical protein